MREDELLALCKEFYSLGVDGMYLKKWRKGLPKDAVGNRAGNSHHSGYKYIKIAGKLYGEHRLVWLMVNGSFPDCDLDHEDTNKSNNAIDNLRKSTRRQNMTNRNGWAKSGFKGVYPNKRGKPWNAKIRVNGEDINLGNFYVAEDAAKAYDIAAIKANGEFAKLNFDLENYK